MEPSLNRTISPTLGLVCILFTSHISAQVLPFHRFAIEQGLVSNGVGPLLQDSKGYLWIGTGEGLSIFDGTTFRNLTSADGLSMNAITSLSESRTSPGTVFIGTWGGGISRWTDGQFTSLAPDSTPPAMNIIDVQEDNSGALWCITESGVYRWANGGYHRLDALDNANALLIARESLVWIACGMSVRMYAPGSAGELDRMDLPGDGEVTEIHQDRSGSIWIATTDRLLLEVKDRRVISQHRVPFKVTGGIADDASGNLWLGTLDGLLKLRRNGLPPPQVTRYTKEHGLSVQWVKGCLVDSENNLWVSNDGLLRLSDWNIQSFPLRGVPVSYNNSKAVTDGRGHIWTVTGSGVLEVWKSRSGFWQSYLHPVRIDLHGKSMPTVVFDRKNRLWIDTGHRIEVYSIDTGSSAHSLPKKIRVLRPGAELPPDPRFFFAIDSRENLWISTFARGAYRVNLSSTPPAFRQFTISNGLPHNDIRVIHEDRRGSLWFGGVADGIAMMPAGTDSIAVKYALKDGLPDDCIRGIVQDESGRIWVATRRNGIGLYDNGQFKHISVREGLLGSAIWALAADDANHVVWAGTHFGVQSIDLSSLAPLQSRKVLMQKSVASLGTYRDQYLWYVSDDALTVYEYNSAVSTTAPPRVYITRLSVAGHERDTRKALAFGYNENLCVFDYIGISYRDTDAMRFQYRLLGAEIDWQPPTTQRTVTYASLSPGSYTFEVRATNGDGITTHTPARLAFSIASPFWATWWFIGLSVVTLVGVVTLAIRSRVRRLLEIERLRSRIARDLHDEIGSNLSSIAMTSDLLGRQSEFGDRERGKLSQISSVALTTVKDMKDIVWLINPANDSLDDLFLKMKDLASTVLEGCQCIMSFPDGTNDRRVNLEWKRNMYFIYKESLTNIVKHAWATEVRIKARITKDRLLLEVSDNGRGFDPQHASAGNGLKNMRERTRMLGAKLNIETSKDGGTIVSLETRIT